MKILFQNAETYFFVKKTHTLIFVLFQFPELTALNFVDANVVVSGNIFIHKQILIIRLFVRSAPILYFNFLIVTVAVRIFSLYKTKTN